MSRYIIRRLLQAIPTLFFISLIVYGLIIISPVDPLAIYEENPNMTPGDMAMLEWRLGLRQPAFLNFRGSNGTLKTDVGTLKSDVAALKQTIERLETEIASLRAAIQSLEAQLERDRSDRQDLREQVLDLRRRLGELDDRVHEIEGRLPPE